VNTARRTDEAGVGGVGVVDGALEEVLVEAGDVVVRLQLPLGVVRVQRERARVLLRLLHGLQRLHRRRAHVQHLRRHRRRLPRGRAAAARRGRGRHWLVVAGRHRRSARSVRGAALRVHDACVLGRRVL
jgi:hypothetical protein